MKTIDRKSNIQILQLIYLLLLSVNVIEKNEEQEKKIKCESRNEWKLIFFLKKIFYLQFNIPN